MADTTAINTTADFISPLIIRYNRYRYYVERNVERNNAGRLSQRSESSWIKGVNLVGSKE